MTDTTEVDLDSILKEMHPIPPNQDGECSEIEWRGLGHGSGIGKWKCKLQKESYGDLLYGGGSENTDYKPCDCSNHEECDVYNENKP